MKIILLIFLKRIFFLGFAASTSLAVLFFGHSALAQPLNDMALNIPFEQTYRNIDPQPKTDKQRIEVLDFFGIVVLFATNFCLHSSIGRHISLRTLWYATFPLSCKNHGFLMRICITP